MTCLRKCSRGITPCRQGRSTLDILILDEGFPYPLNSGKRIRTFNLVSRLARNHRVRYLAYGHSRGDSRRELETAGIETIAVKQQVPGKSGPVFYARLAANLLSSEPYVVSSHHSADFRKAVQAAISNRKPDVVIAEWTPYSMYFDTCAHLKRVIVAHNVETDIWKRYYDNETNRVKKWYIRRQMEKMERFERGAFGSADGATAVSERDAEVIRSFNPRMLVSVIDNGVDLDYFAAATDDRRRSSKLVFTGAMDWRPNQDAVMFFVDAVYPLLREKYPGIEAAFVGRNPPGQIARLGTMAGITVTGTVDDIRPHVRDAAVYVVPMRIGGGSRLKILEALAMGIPVVSTTVGAEGLDVMDGENILIADSPVEFVRQVGNLLGNRELAARLGSAGRELVERRYGWDFIAGKLERFLDDVVWPA